MLILLPVCRTIMRWIRPKVKWLPLDENLWFHRQLAYAMLFYTCLHTAAHYVKYVILSRSSEATPFLDLKGSVVLTGWDIASTTSRGRRSVPGTPSTSTTSRPAA